MSLRSAQQDLEALVTATGCGCTTEWADPLFDDSLIELTAPDGKVWLCNGEPLIRVTGWPNTALIQDALTLASLGLQPVPAAT